MGVQSFDAGLLESCGRAHSLQDVYDAVQVIRQAGINNFSIDLMRCVTSILVTFLYLAVQVAPVNILTALSLVRDMDFLRDRSMRLCP